jgi:hypothetical protein
MLSGTTALLALGADLFADAVACWRVVWTNPTSGLGRARPISAGWATRKALRNRLLLALSPQDARGIALWPVLCGQLAIACYGRL